MLKEMDYTARVILSFFIATVIFIVIFSLASSAVHYNLDLATKGNAHITKYIAEIGASLENFSCEEDLLYEASSKLDEVGGNIGFQETKIGRATRGFWLRKSSTASLNSGIHRWLTISAPDAGQISLKYSSSIQTLTERTKAR